MVRVLGMMMLLALPQAALAQDPPPPPPPPADAPTQPAPLVPADKGSTPGKKARWCGGTQACGGGGKVKLVVATTVAATVLTTVAVAIAVGVANSQPAQRLVVR